MVPAYGWNASKTPIDYLLTTKTILKKQCNSFRMKPFLYWEGNSALKTAAVGTAPADEMSPCKVLYVHRTF